MVSNVQNVARIHVILGDEFDQELRDKLINALRLLGASPLGAADRFLAGSQDLEQFEVMVNGQQLFIESETYVGLSLSGPSDLVQQVRQLIEHN